MRIEAFGVDSRKKRSLMGKVQAEVTSMETVFDRATQLLTTAGLKPEDISTKFKVKENGVAQDIISELEQGDYDIVVIGRRGLSKLKGFLLGSVSSTVVCRVKCATIWIVP
jgi:nucleotide-binding universal stress UspA family protein